MNLQKLILPNNVSNLLAKLKDNGYSAYIVGGCVRDSLMGRTPTDWDITTDAHPDAIMRIFPRHFDSGSSFGTITVLCDGVGYEVTTYRIDGEYKDKRHPQGVAFATELKDDLCRRDFTINAIAYNEEDGYVDLFGGIEDIENGLIRGVGDPSARFQEDALRMLRAIRFSAQLGFSIEESTLQAIHLHAELLCNVSMERIRDEFCKTLLSPNPYELLTLIETGLWKHFLLELNPDSLLCRRLKTTLPLLPLRLLILLESDCVDDIGKAEVILRRLRFDGKTIKTVSQLLSAIGLYDNIRSGLKSLFIKKTLRLLGTEGFELLINFYESEPEKYLTSVVDALRHSYTSIIQTNQCITLKQLSVNGHDMQRLSFVGSKVGETLEWLLEQVYCDDSLNTRDSLLALLKTRPR